MKKLMWVWCFILSHVVYGETPSDLLQQKLQAMRSMSANFSQTVRAKKRELSQSSGTMALERPGRFRWDTKEPLAQLVVADSQHLWVYDMDLEQVTVKKQGKGLGGTAGLFLSGADDTLTRDFEVKMANEGNNQRFDLNAKSSKENFQNVQLVFKGEQLIRIELLDQLGQRTTVQLSNVKNNPSLAASLFKFKPPKGVDVVKQ